MVFSEYFWLYKISYLYNGVIGFLVTMIIGYLISYISRKITKEEIRPMDTNLFVPPLAKKLEKLWDQPLNLRAISESEDDIRKVDKKKNENVLI